jgi:nicotinamide-nucleotide amidase
MGPDAAAEALLEACRAAGAKIATVESCTGGLVAAALTSVPGSHDAFDRGWVTYSNEAKTALVGVPPALIAEHGAVSEEVARAMAEGGLARSAARFAVSVTGVAGPGGGTLDKPVGLVCFGLAERDGATATAREVFPGDRAAVRAAAVARALRLIREALDR